MTMTPAEKRKLLTDKLIVEGKISESAYLKMHIMLDAHRKQQAEKALANEVDEQAAHAIIAHANEYNAQVDADRAAAARVLLEASAARSTPENTTRVAANESMFSFDQSGRLMVAMDLGYKKPLHAATHIVELNHCVDILSRHLAPEERLLVPRVLEGRYQDDHGVERLSDGTSRTQRQSATNPLQSTMEYAFAKETTTEQKKLVSTVYTAASIMQDYRSKRNQANFFQLQTPVEYFLAKNNAYLDAHTQPDKQFIPEDAQWQLSMLSLLVKSASLKETQQYSPEKQAKLDVLTTILAHLKTDNSEYLTKKF